MRSTAEVLEGNKVKLSVEVDEEDLAGAVDETVRRLQKEARVPGFRPGKVPRRLLEARLGTKAIREEVIRSSLPDYYAQAVEDAALDTIAAPEIDITSGEDTGPLSFDAVVEIRPKASVAGYEGLQITVPAPAATEDEVDAQIDRLREQFAQLHEVDREVRAGDVVTIDVSAERDGEPVEDLSTVDFVYEVGTGMIASDVDEKLVGAKAGDIVEVEAEEAPGGGARMRVLVKLVREKVLPDADDEWASEASEFDTLEELRADLRKRLTAVRRLQARIALQDNAVTELAKLVDVDIPETLLNRELARLQNDFLHRLEHRRLSLPQYLEATGRDTDQLSEDLKTQALEAVRVDLALRALAEAEAIDVSDDDLVAEITTYAESLGQPVSAVAEQFAEGAALERLRSEIRNSKAAGWLVEHVEVVDEQGNPMERALLEQDGAPDEEDSPGDETDEEGSSGATVGAGKLEEGEPDGTERDGTEPEDTEEGES